MQEVNIIHHEDMPWLKETVIELDNGREFRFIFKNAKFVHPKFHSKYGLVKCVVGECFQVKSFTPGNVLSHSTGSRVIKIFVVRC